MKTLFLALCICSTPLLSQPRSDWAVGRVFPTRETSVHDPVMTRQDSVYYIFCTGRGISVWSSKNMQEWRREKPVFSEAPKWAVEAVPGFRGHIWAPDISFYLGQYYLYYSVSAFGKNTSCIGLATNKTLHPDDPDFAWIDHGKVIQSIPGVTNWNAIDPNLIVDESGTPYLVFGSFGDGIKMVKLSPDGMSVAEDIKTIPTIATRKTDPSISGNLPAVEGNTVDAGGNAIEAPFIFKKGDYYFLFASIDYCCKGVNSTYKMIVGRSKYVRGPYIDKEGIPLARGGGTILLAGDKTWPGVGHNAVVNFDGIDYLVFHGYDANDNGRSKLRIEKLKWADGWPEVIIEPE
jgi:arabinan endo-1,5-alpha-L-arabinosidase